jgi:putative transposase
LAIISVRLYFRFNLSLRYVEEILFERGIVVSIETIRRWCRKHTNEYARRLRHKAPWVPARCSAAR